TIARHHASSRKSTLSAIAFAPSASRSLTAAALFSALRAATTIAAPACASPRAIPRPMPPLPPVTIATRPFRSKSFMAGLPGVEWAIMWEPAATIRREASAKGEVLKAAPSSGRVFAVLAAGVLVMSTASILIRWLQADSVPSLSIAAWRLGLAALLLAPLVLIRHRAALARLAPRDWLLAAAAGAFLAAHFATWIRSLEYTSVASSVALVTTNPIWIGIASWVVFRERLSAVMLFAIALAIAGSAVIFLADGGRGGPQGSAPALGNALAIVGSLAICGYLLIGRGLRRSIALVPYVGVVYAAAAVCLVVVALAAGAPLGGFAR